MNKNKKVSKVKLFVELPSYLVNASMLTTVPENLIIAADKKMELDGELISYFKKHAVNEFDQIEFLEESERRSFFANQILSKRWDSFSALTNSGMKWNVLVEFK